MDRRVTPPKRVTSPIWGPPPPCKQALRPNRGPKGRKNYFVFLCEYSGPFWGMFSNIGLDVDEKSCVFEEGRHLGPTLPAPDPVSPHFSPPVIIQRPLLAGFMKTAPAGTWRPHTSNWLNWSKYCQDEDWYWPVEISQLNSISRCLISPCKSLLDCNVFNFMYLIDHDLFGSSNVEQDCSYTVFLSRNSALTHGLKVTLFLVPG